MNPFTDRVGYLYIALHDRQGGQVRRPVHQLVIEAFVGPCPEGHQVDHIDHNRGNNALTNLRYLTVKENCGRGNAEFNRRTKSKEIALQKDGVIYWARSQREMSRYLDIRQAPISQLFTNQLKSYKGYTLLC